jgi:hypothetical protein
VTTRVVAITGEEDVMNDRRKDGDGALMMVAFVGASVVAIALVVVTQACAALPGVILALRAGL